MLSKKVQQFITREQLLQPSELHLVALSGGADSVALLLVLHSLGYRVEAAHCNFQLRGEESMRDEQFARELCRQHDIPFHLIHFDTTTYATLHHVSIEMAARQLRYRYFEQLRRDIGAADICVAHHQDDAVETLLINLVRGTGIHGLTGIRPRRNHIVRPLLCASKHEITEYLDAISQPYVTDSTNLVADVQRNKLRLQVMPLLRQLNPAASENIATTARRMAQAERVFNDAMQRQTTAVCRNGNISIEALLRQPSPEYLLHELLSPKGFTPTQVEAIASMVSGGSTATTDAALTTGRRFTSPTHELVIDRGYLITEQRQPLPPPLTIPETGIYRLSPSLKVSVRITDEVNVSRHPERATLDAGKVAFPLTVRTVEPGDRFQPYGMKGTRLVSDFLTDLKVNILEKRRQLVVTDAGGRILWLVNRRTDHRFAVEATTRQVLDISLATTP